MLTPDKLPKYKQLYEIWDADPNAILNSSKKDAALKLIGQYKDYLNQQKLQQQQARENLALRNSPFRNFAPSPSRPLAPSPPPPVAPSPLPPSSSPPRTLAPSQPAPSSIDRRRQHYADRGFETYPKTLRDIYVPPLDPSSPLSPSSSPLSPSSSLLPPSSSPPRPLAPSPGRSGSPDLPESYAQTLKRQEIQREIDAIEIQAEQIKKIDAKLKPYEDELNKFNQFIDQETKSFTGTAKQYERYQKLYQHYNKILKKYQPNLDAWNNELLPQYQNLIQQYNELLPKYHYAQPETAIRPAQPQPQPSGTPIGAPGSGYILRQPAPSSLRPLSSSPPRPLSAQSPQIAQMILEVSRKTQIPPHIVEKNFEPLVKQLSKEYFGKKPEATAMEHAEFAMIFPIAAGLMAHPLATVKGVLSFGAVSEMVNGLTSLLTQQKYQFGGGKGLEQAVPYTSTNARKVLEIIDFLGKAAITHGLYKAAPVLFEKFTKNVFEGYKLPRTITISPEEVRAAQIDGKGVSAEKLQALKGLKSGAEWRAALKKGTVIELEARDFIKIVDKPYWRKIKKAFKVKPFEETRFLGKNIKQQTLIPESYRLESQTKGKTAPSPITHEPSPKSLVGELAQKPAKSQTQKIEPKPLVKTTPSDISDLQPLKSLKSTPITHQPSTIPESFVTPKPQIPYKTVASAKSAIKSRKLSPATHSIVKINDGFALAPNKFVGITKIGGNERQVFQTPDGNLYAWNKKHTKKQSYTWKDLQKYRNRSAASKAAFYNLQENNILIPPKTVSGGDMPALYAIWNAGVARQIGKDSKGKPSFEYHYDQISGFLIGDSYIGASPILNRKSKKFTYDLIDGAHLEGNQEFIKKYGRPDEMTFDDVKELAEKELAEYAEGLYNDVTHHRFTDDEIAQIKWDKLTPDEQRLYILEDEMGGLIDEAAEKEFQLEEILKKETDSAWDDLEFIKQHEKDRKEYLHLIEKGYILESGEIDARTQTKPKTKQPPQVDKRDDRHKTQQPRPGLGTKSGRPSRTDQGINRTADRILEKQKKTEPDLKSAPSPPRPSAPSPPRPSAPPPPRPVTPPPPRPTSATHADAADYPFWDSPDYIADQPSVIGLPEIIKLNKLITQGKLPKIMDHLRKAAALGLTKGDEANILAEIAIGHKIFDKQFKEKPDPDKIKAEFLKDNPKYFNQPLEVKITRPPRAKQYTLKIFRVDPTLLQRVVAHELGHIIDFLPNRSTNPGNILGRIANLKKYLKHILPEKPGAPGELTAKDRARFRNIAQKNLKGKIEIREIVTEIQKVINLTPKLIHGVWSDIHSAEKFPELTEFVAMLSDKEKVELMKSAIKGKVPDWAKTVTKTEKKIETLEVKLDANPADIRKEYERLIVEELKKRKLFQLEEIMSELIKLTQKWKPFDVTARKSYARYRHSSPELYADAISVLINKPEMLKQIAPSFYKAFFNYLENKPRIKKAYDQIQALLKKGEDAIFEDRLKTFFADVEKGRKVADIARRRNEKSFRDLWGELMSNFVTKGHYLRKDVKKAKVSPENNPYYFYKQIPYVMSNNFQYVRDLSNTVKLPLEKNKIDQKYFDFYLMLIRSTTERKYLANPGGYNLPEGVKTLQKLKKHLGTEKFSQLEKSKAALIKARKENVFPLLRKSKAYDSNFMKYIEDNENYFTFSVYKFLTDKYKYSNNLQSAKIFNQIGTFEAIRGPFEATMLKDISLMAGAVRTIAAQKLVDFYLNPDNKLTEKISISKRDGKGRIVMARGDYKTISYLYEGKTRAYDLPKEIVEAYEYNDLHMQTLVKYLSILNRPFKELFVGKNPFWALLTNLPRDIKRTWINNPEITIINLAKNLAKIAPDVFKDVFLGISTPKVRKLYQQRRLPAYRLWMSGRNPEESYADMEIKQFETSPRKYIDNIYNPWRVLMTLLEDIAAFTEKVVKAGGSIALEEQGLRGAELVFRTMIGIGSPDFMQKGFYTALNNNIKLFSNAAIQGWDADIEAVLRNPRSFFFRTTVANIIPKILMWAAKAGILATVFKLLSDDPNDEKYANWLQEAFSKIPEYDLTNYHCIPIGETESGKVVYIIRPPDFSGKIISGLMWKLLNIEKDFNPSDIIRFVNGEMPLGSLSPAIQFALDALAFAGGKNIWDTFRGQTAISPQDWTAGGLTRLKAFFRYEWNSYGGYYIYKWKSDDMIKIQSDLEKFLGQPIIGQGLRKFIRVSDRGKVEEFQHTKRTKQALSAIKNKLIDRSIISSINSKTPINKLPIAALYKKLLEEGYDVKSPREFFSQYKKKYNQQLLRKRDTAISRNLYSVGGSVKTYIDLQLKDLENITKQDVLEELEKIHNIYTLPK